MSKTTLYWLGEGVLTYKDSKDGDKYKDLKYADEIPDGVLTPERIKKLMKDGAIGEKPVPVKATETAALKNEVKRLKGENDALRAGEDGQAVARAAELETRVEELERLNNELSAEKTDLENKLENVQKELTDAVKAAGKGGDKPEKPAEGGVSPAAGKGAKGGSK
jgi:ribosomal protein L19E